ncbi:MAG: four helix bundle protein [Bacteroidetes bacterium]|nr:four helix bundle protein [Bacteroidota bacterium]
MAQFDDLRKRSKRFAMDVISLFRVLPRTEEARIIGRQLLRSGTSVAANYRASCRARSKAEFVSKIGVVVEEADESVLWLEMLTESGIVPSAKTEALLKEGNELLAIFAASYHTSKFGRDR